MKLLKYFIGSLIISSCVLFVIALIMSSLQINLPEVVARYLLLIWISLAILLLPFAKRIIRA